MNKYEFDKAFSVFCGAYNKKPGNEEFTAKAHWWKVKELSETEYMSIICRAIDTHKIMPSVATLMEIRKNIPKPEERPIQRRNPRYMYNPDGTRMTMRDHFVMADKDIAGKKRHHIEHLDLVALYDKMWKNKNRKRPEVIKGSNIKKLGDCI